MTHFLLRRDREGNLSVHSAMTWGSRKEATDELSRLLTAPDFDDWDSEYFVLDLDTATPILFVKPTASEADEPVAPEETAEEAEVADDYEAAGDFEPLAEVEAEAESEESVEAEVVAVVAVTDQVDLSEEVEPVVELEAVELEPVLEVEVAVEVEPVSEVEALVEFEPVSELEPVAEFETVVELEPIAGLEPEPESAEVLEPLAELEPLHVAEPAAEPEDEDLPMFDPAEEALLADLRADFAAPLTPVADPEPEATVELEPVAELEPLASVEPELEPGAFALESESLLEPLAEMAPEIESALEPVIADEVAFVSEPEFAPQASIASDSTAELETFSAPTAVIENAPDALLDSIAAYVVDEAMSETPDAYEQDIALIAENLGEPEAASESPELELGQGEVVLLMSEAGEAPSEEAEAIEPASLDATEVPVESEPVEAEWPWSNVGEETSAPAPEPAIVHPNPLLAARVSIEDLNAGEPVTEPEPEPIQAEDEGEAISDFILDLQEIPEEAPAESEPQGYRTTTNAVEGMTCQDCIYLETCPNSNERDPASCGSFQWK